MAIQDFTEPAALRESTSRPLCVDLDGTLTPLDTLRVSLRQLVRADPWACWNLPILALTSRARFKAHISDRETIDPCSLPFRGGVLRHLEAQRTAGRILVLATAADHRIALAVAQHLGLFDHVLATKDGVNLKGKRKREAIISAFGPTYDYMGDSWADLPIFAQARHCFLVEPSRYLITRVERMGISYSVVHERQG